MKRRWILLLLVLFGNTLLAEEHCPPGTEPKEKHGGNDSIRWTSSMVTTRYGICFEQRVVVQGNLYVNWPAAEIKKVVHGTEGKTSCCYLDSRPKDYDLEYGLLGSTMHTTVYQPPEGTRAASLEFDGSILVRKTWTPVTLKATASLSPASACGSEKQTCRLFSYTIISAGSPLILRWNKDRIALQLKSPPSGATSVHTGPDGGEFVLQPDAAVSFNFVANLPKSSDEWITVMTPDGTNVIGTLPGKTWK